MEKIISKLKNTKTVISIASMVVLILTTVGVSVDNDTVMTVVKCLCSIGVLLGIMNNNGMDTTIWDDKGTEETE